MAAKPKNVLENGPNNAGARFLFAHGAGAPMDAAFMNIVAKGLARNGVRVIRFEFPYMEKRRREGSRRPPDRAPVLLHCWRDMIESHGGPENVFIGGKSMGGRMASIIAADLEKEGTPVRGVICMGYPFHPPGKPEKLRTEHLRELKSPILVLQGERDPFGKPDEVAGYDLPPAISVHWLPDGDHGLKPRKMSGRTEEQNLAEAVKTAANFMGRNLGG